MALTSAQIVKLACQIAKTSGMTSQAGEFLNSILSDLCQTYDLDVAKAVYQFNFQPGLGGGVVGGPYPLPAAYLRAKFQDFFYTISGYPYFLVAIDLAEFDQTPQAAGLQSFPNMYATDMSQSPPQLWVYPAPSGAYAATLRYYQQMPDIATPETSSTVPWFPNQDYLITKLAGQMMKIAGDDRAEAYLGTNPSKTGAQDILDRYLMLKDDSSNRADTVKLDPRRFGNGNRVLPTKSQPF